MAKHMVIYWGSGSAPCWKALIALEEKGLQGYNSKLISFEKKEHKTEEVLKINPRGQVKLTKDNLHYGLTPTGHHNKFLDVKDTCYT